MDDFICSHALWLLLYYQYQRGQNVILTHSPAASGGGEPKVNCQRHILEEYRCCPIQTALSWDVCVSVCLCLPIRSTCWTLNLEVVMVPQRHSGGCGVFLSCPAVSDSLLV